MIRSWDLPHDVEANIYAGVIPPDDLRNLEEWQWRPLGTIITSPGVTGGAYFAPYEEEEKKMATHINDQDAAVVALREARAAEAAQRGSELLEKVRDWELHGMARGTIIKFTKDFGEDRAYRYAAIKCGGKRDARWYVTGDMAPFTSGRLEELLVTDGGFRDLEVVHTGLDAGEDE